MFQIEPLFNTIEKQNIKKKKTVGIQLTMQQDMKLLKWPML
jgi:hypothetical protein